MATPKQEAELINIMTRVRKAKTRTEKARLLRKFDSKYRAYKITKPR